MVRMSVMRRFGIAIGALWIAIFPGLALAFSDVSGADPAADAISYLHGEGIVKGYDDDTFRPQQTINRAEFTKIVMGALYSEAEIAVCLDQGFGLGFSDVGAGAWFAPAVCMAKRNGIVSGYSNGTFRPANTINVAEAAKILAFAYDLSAQETEPWYQGPLQALGQRNALPLSIGAADKPLKRGEMAQMIYTLTTGRSAGVGQPVALVINGVEHPSRYQDYTEGVLEMNKVKVLFFHAPWCPFCRAHDLKLRMLYDNDPPDNMLDVYRVDYDSSLELRKRFEVTSQDTFVKVMPSGVEGSKLVLPSEAAMIGFLQP